MAKLQIEKSRLVAKGADLQRKVDSATVAASKTKSISMLKSKLGQIERLRKASSANERAIARIDGKIAAEHKKLNNAQKSLSSEEEKQAKKRQCEANQLNLKIEQQMTMTDRKLRQHDSLHHELMSDIERLKNLPETITVLFLASNPLDQEQLRLDEEARAIQDMIRRSQHRDAVRLESRWAVRPQDVMQAINECNPRIVHFSGHGSDNDEIVFQDEFGNTKPVTKEAIVQVMLACSGNIQLVFFNTCYSRNQAEAVVEHTQSALGMSTSIDSLVTRGFRVGTGE